MPTAVESPKATHGSTADHIQRFEKKINTMRSALAALPSDDTTNTLLKFIHQPGWTTPAESVFFETIVDSVISQTEQLEKLHKQLMAGAALVGR